MENQKNLTAELKRFLLDKGASLAGVGDMAGTENCRFRYGISVALPVSAEVVKPLQEKPTPEYYRKYTELNKRLNDIILAGEAFLKDRGYPAYALTTDRVNVEDHFVSEIPHKTVAVHAGLGWIGKNCLLVTEKFGSAVRISSLFTDAPLEADQPVRKSKCGKCILCVNACPGHALKGALWQAGMPREDIIKLERYSKETELLGRNHIETSEDLEAFKERLTQQIEGCSSEKAEVNKQLRRKISPERADELKKNIRMMDMEVGSISIL